jgi:hypothetical protein
VSRLEEVWWDGKKRFIQVRKRALQESPTSLQKDPCKKATTRSYQRALLQAKQACFGSLNTLVLQTIFLEQAATFIMGECVRIMSVGIVVQLSKYVIFRRAASEQGLIRGEMVHTRLCVCARIHTRYDVVE